LQVDDTDVTVRAAIARFVQQQDINFLLTNRLPRRWLTLLMGRVSRIEQPLVFELAMALWRLFGDLDLSDARATTFRSLHECFTRQLQDGARPVDPDPAIIVSPCDAIVGAMGRVRAGAVLQAKGAPYSLLDLLVDPALVRAYGGGSYVTLRLTAGMYHRFHAPHDCRIEQVTYVSGDTWNVNPIALQRIERLFCRNERAIIRCRLSAPAAHSAATKPGCAGPLLTLVPVAAILVASIRLHCIDVPLNLRYRGPNIMPCDAALQKGAELGWFEHGSTLIVFAPPGVELCDGLQHGRIIRMGQPLMRLTAGAP
jgi:phosphatidylserine decarboxylase